MAIRFAKGLFIGLLVATAMSQAEEVSLGQVFLNVVEAPPEMQPGDVILITDPSLFDPADAIADVSVKGKWWRRGYRTEDSSDGQFLLCVEEQDLDDPESCLAPKLTLPLNLHGWYEVWVRTYRHREGGGIDVRLSGEPYFVHADPLQIGIEGEKPSQPYGTLVDVQHRAADLTGQDLIFQQPYGTYESQNLLCNASLAGVRLVKLSNEQVTRIQADRRREDVKVIGYDNDGFSYFHRWAVHDPTCIARLVEPLRDQSAAFLNVELGGLGGLHIPTPYTGMYQMRGHTRHGDYRANAFYRWSFENNVDMVDVLAERAHAVGVKLFVSLMMERSFSVDAAMRVHPEWKIKRGPGQWDYAIPKVRDYQVKKIVWIIENHDVDGFIVDFTRYGHYFNEDEPDKFGHMNTFVRQLRSATDDVNARKPRKVRLCASFGDESWHLKHWGTGKLEDQGLDVETWLAEGIFDILMPEGPRTVEYVTKAKDSRTAIWPRVVARVTIKTHEKVDGQEGPKDIERGVQWLFDNGAEGVFFFNHETWGSLGRLGFRDELAARAQTDEVYGLREGPIVTFTDWYPNLDERTAQRETLKPVLVALDAEHRIDEDIIVPVRNTFPEPVTVQVAFDTPWDMMPSSQTAAVASEKQAAPSFHVAGSAKTEDDTPMAEISFTFGDQVVLRHRAPVRAVPRVVCKPADAADAEWHKLSPPGNAKLQVTRDDANLYLSCERTGVDVSKVDRQPAKRDSRAVWQGDYVTVVIDTQCDETAYVELVATPGRGMADASWRYDPFLGHHGRDLKWNAEWTTATVWRDDGYAMTFTIPFEALGGPPSPGTVWRINTVTVAKTAAPKPESYGWSSPRVRDPAAFGILAFE